MQFNINIKKRHAFLIVAVVVLVGFAVAYGTNDPPTMGHSVGEIETGLSGNPTLSLSAWSNGVENRITNYKWTSTAPNNPPYFSATLLSSPNPGVTVHPIPASIPSSAKEILVSAYVTKNTGGSPAQFDINVYTYDGGYYVMRVPITANYYVYATETMWLPMPPNRELVAHVPAGVVLTGVVSSGIRIIGYR